MRLFFRLFLWLSITVLSLQGSAALAAGQQNKAAHESMALPAHHCHQVSEHPHAEHCIKTGAKGACASHAKCATCPSCCAGVAALPALPPGFHAPPLTASLHAPSEAAMTSVVPSTLDRPPRRLLA